MSPRRRGGRRGFPRSARLGPLLKEIIAEELELIEDPRLELATVMNVRVDNELEKAVVTVAGPAEVDELLEALAEHSGRLRSAIGSQARLRRLPRLEFVPDTVGHQAQRVEEILRGLAAASDPPSGDEAPDGDDG